MSLFQVRLIACLVFGKPLFLQDRKLVLSRNVIDSVGMATVCLILCQDRYTITAGLLNQDAAFAVLSNLYYWIQLTQCHL